MNTIQSNFFHQIRTSATGGGGSGQKRTNADRGGGGVKKGGFFADVLYGRPQRLHISSASIHYHQQHF